MALNMFGDPFMTDFDRSMDRAFNRMMVRAVCVKGAKGGREGTGAVSGV